MTVALPEPALKARPSGPARMSWWSSVPPRMVAAPVAAAMLGWPGWMVVRAGLVRTGVMGPLPAAAMLMGSMRDWARAALAVSSKGMAVMWPAAPRTVTAVTAPVAPVRKVGLV